jgi:GGDEF domain-containing protein
LGSMLFYKVFYYFKRINKFPPQQADGVLKQIRKHFRSSCGGIEPEHE